MKFSVFSHFSAVTAEVYGTDHKSSFWPRIAFSLILSGFSYFSHAGTDIQCMLQESCSSEFPDLAGIPLLSGMHHSRLEALSRVMERRRVAKGKYVLRADEPGEFIMFLISGKLKVQRSCGSRVLVLEILKPGDIFGELALLTNRSRSADIKALQDSVIFILARRDFEEHILGDPVTMRALLSSLASRLYATSIKAADLSLLDVYRRVARILASLGETKQGENGTISVIEERPTHSDLAALAGTSREMVTRALADLKRSGHITIDGRRVVVHSIPW